MPRYDFKCRVCNEVFERIAPVEVTTVQCYICKPVYQLGIPLASIADRQLSFPAQIHIH
jgi:phage FluMu protein Com